ncbi:MAG TPA: GreA/GreB family elongation factor [Bacteroidales bacterium]|nr:GreA/GreB family elongation factor [Bacteroidales bacterium]HRZ48984.1 GreA/GreB family elongation factor [Bacteroidales bacterium]
MSRGFVKEDDQEEVPMVAPRAFLPPGVPNYVTRTGLEALLTEREALLKEKEDLRITTEKERRLAVNHIHARLKLLDERIASAKPIDPGSPPPAEVKFGASVTIRLVKTGEAQTIQIVGVDEADVPRGKISFISPLARALINKKPGEKAVWKVPGEERVFEILEITYR